MAFVARRRRRQTAVNDSRRIARFRPCFRDSSRPRSKPGQAMWCVPFRESPIRRNRRKGVMLFPESELKDWAIVSYKDDTGLGRMAEDARRVLGIGHQIVIPSRRLQTKPLETGDLLLRDDLALSELRAFFS